MTGWLASTSNEIKIEFKTMSSFRYQQYLAKDRAGTYAMSRIIDRYIATILKDDTNMLLSNSQEDLLMDLHIVRDILEMSYGYVDTFNLFSPVHFRQVLERISQVKVTTEYERLYVYHFVFKIDCLMSEAGEEDPTILNHYIGLELVSDPDYMSRD
ncbi:hypothetical protein FHR71_005294 [Methylobacterium sp. RAS18]|nr:hypothetical protein [Methylobacterium sp. RAS18]